LWPLGSRYVLTDFRLVVDSGHHSDEIALQDIADVQRRVGSLDRLLRTSTLLVAPRGRRRQALELRHVRRGAQLAALLELLAGDPQARLDANAVRAALAWSLPAGTGARGTVAAIAAALIALVAAIGLRGIAATPPLTHRSDDPISPAGEKRSREEIVRFMETEVMPWARSALAPIVGGAAAVRCATCHGEEGEASGWRMPAVAALPAPQFRALGWEIYSAGMNPQVRNAIYGYLAEPDKQHKAGYMREIVMPGMARLLRRPSYDFTRSYEYNQSRLAFGCYHCHRMGEGEERN
jgi:hypothetical protein